MTSVSLTVNGQPFSADVEPRTHLADFLRETHNLTGTHIGCEHGVCGACTLLVDGVPVRSCITFAVACDKAEVTTIEGLDNDDISIELRKAFTREHALQCGYCTPGMLVSARDVVLRFEAPTEHDVRIVMSGNLCRCTGYVGIVRAILSVVADRRARGIHAIPNGGRTELGPAGCGHASPVAAVMPSSRAAEVVETKKGKAASAAGSEAGKFDPNWKPQTSFRQTFTVAHSAEDVWDFFGRIGDVVSCLPGATLNAPPEDGHVEGRIRVKVGPISAEFQGVADVTRDKATHSGTIIGAGRDARSNSATRGVIRYFIKPDDQSEKTRVDVDVGFTLTGMLAQFGRSGLVQDVANRLTGAFVQNLEARLDHAASGGEGEIPVAVVSELNALELVWSIIRDRAQKLLNKILNRS